MSIDFQSARELFCAKLWAKNQLFLFLYIPNNIFPLFDKQYQCYLKKSPLTPMVNYWDIVQNLRKWSGPISPYEQSSKWRMKRKMGVLYVLYG